MNVQQVIEQVSAWVEREGRQIPWFRGAHLLGSILTMPHDAPFPLYRDVDLNIVVDDEMHTTTTHDVAASGLMKVFTGACGPRSPRKQGLQTRPRTTRCH